MSIKLSVSTMLNQLHSTGSYSYKTHKTAKTIDEDKCNAAEKSISINTSLRNLRKTDTSTVGGKTKAKKHIKNIISAFNDLKDNAATSSKSSRRTMSKLSGLLEEYSDELEALGIRKSQNGKYSLNNAKWEDLEGDKLSEALDKVFGKESDFSKKFEKYNKSLKSIMRENQIQTKNITLNNTVNIDNNKISMAGSANNLTTYIASFASAKTGDEAVTYMNEIISNFNNIFIKEKDAGSNSEYLDMLSKLVLNNKTDLNNVGLDCNDDGTSISFSADDNSILKDKYTEAETLFSGDFGEKISDAAKALFCDLLDTENNGITVNEYI